MKHRLLVTTALAGFSLFTAFPAFAACTNNPPSSGQTVDCSGTNNNTSIQNAGATGVTVNLDNNATLDDGGSDPAILLGGGATINLGAGASITSSGASIALTNGGAITTGAGSTFSGTSMTGGAGDVITLTLGGNVGIFGFNNTAGTANLLSTYSVSTLLDGGNGGADTLNLAGSTNGIFNTNQLGATITSFETLGKTGSSTWELTGANAQDWSITAGALTTTTTASLANASVGAGATLDFDDVDGAYTGDVTGAGDWDIRSGSILTLSGNNNGMTGLLDITGSSNVTFADAGALTGGDIRADLSTVTFGSGMTSNNDWIIGSADATFDTGAGNVTIGGVVSGTGGALLGKNGSGSLTLGGANTFDGGLNVNAGEVVLADIDGAGTGIITNNNLLTVAANGTLDNTINGSGNIVYDGSAVTVTGANGYSGTTSFVNGANVTAGAAARLGNGASTNDLIFDDGTLTYSAAFDLARDIALGAGDGTLNTNGFNSTLSGVISGAGDLAKTGTGILTLSNTNTYTGMLNINGGSVNVSGAAGDITIGNTGALRGIGTVGDTIVNAGGTFSPGNSIGTMNVTGDLTFNSGSHYAVEYTATPNDSDKIIATGNIVINNGAILDLTGANGNYFANTNYTILSGATRTGVFTTVNNNLVFLDVDFDDSTATDLIMTLTRNNTSFADILAEDEGEFATAFDQLANDLTTAFTNLTAAQAQDAASQLSNEQQGATTTFAASANANILTGISNRMGRSFSSDLEEVASGDGNDGTYTAAYMEPAAGGTFNRDVNLWFKAIGSKGFTDSSANEPSQTRYSYGALAGIDRALDDKGFYGFFAGYEYGEVETRSQHASSTVANYHAGAYMLRPVGRGFVFNTGAALTYHDIDSVRYVVFPGFDAAPRSDTQGYSASGFVEFSKPMKAQVFDFAPFVSFALAHTKIDGYEEQGGGLANLVAGDTSVTNPLSVIGARFTRDLQIGEAALGLFGSLGWQHVYGEIQPQSLMRFANGTAYFHTDGAARAQDAALISMGINARISDVVNAFAGYNAAISGSNFDHGVEIGVKIKF